VLKNLLKKPSYVALVGILNLATGLSLVPIMVHLHNQSNVMGLMILMSLNLAFGANNFIYGLREMKPEPKLKTTPEPTEAELSD
jgi:hypothetical protein